MSVVCRAPMMPGGLANTFLQTVLGLTQPPIRISPFKELRFAISLPFSVADDAGNGRLSATLICHAPAPFGHALTDPFLLPQAMDMWVPTSFVPQGLIKCFILTHCTLMGALKMASFSTPAARVWLVPNCHGYKCTFPNYCSSNFLSPISIATC